MRDHKMLGQYLRQCRVKAGLTQSQISRQLGYSSPQFVSNWERGQSMPPFNSVGKLVKLIKIDPRKFLDIYLEDTRRILLVHFKKHLKR